ncbi:hypothetical protein C4C99_RS16525 [Vibrio parahaemolyticus]|uniref:hypothetical protein n=1 Tax=Vibrio vulnificus TaxID=672 RepID=UPI0005F212AB|nr:hypothetical protein [Vibrio vulnificus]EGQ8131478.1 hypothetical protein [Vibrio parahaemolyticus]EGQ8281193.1 hypothetical protein [Vibrio parahaemolyticus]EGQ8719276.1 hypothetical protein [Vibrio parahaemolyticus]EGQ8812387.1 hypothetical protein [Vibrio parahaemolyticus]EGQ8835765.1 hypothetical protein [Vibrio parahaemolyticus]
MEQLHRRIAHALYLDGWQYEGGSRATLLKDAERIQPLEYTKEMKGALFCPMCFTNLNRVPHDREHNAANMEAHFRHLPTYSGVPCALRSQRAEGKKYSSVEVIKQAIDNEELVIVNGFLKDKPEQRIPANARPFDEYQVEDVEGPEAEVPLGQHAGESFKVPSKITTLRGICYNFDKNYYRYYFIPGYQHAIALTSLLNDVRDVEEEDDKPKLYFGKVKSSTHHGNPPRDNNIRMTYLEKSPKVIDFCIKTPHWLQNEHGIGDDSKGRYVLVYGKVEENGIGLCFNDLGWGELALVPEKYNYLLDNLYDNRD